MNEKKPQLLATFENRAWEFAKQLLNLLAVFEPEPLATYLFLKKKKTCIETKAPDHLLLLHLNHFKKQKEVWNRL